MDELKGELPAPYDNSCTRQTDFWKWEVFDFHGSLLNTCQCEGQRICPIQFKEPLPGSELEVCSQHLWATSLALPEMSKQASSIALRCNGTLAPCFRAELCYLSGEEVRGTVETS